MNDGNDGCSEAMYETKIKCLPLLLYTCDPCLVFVFRTLLIALQKCLRLRLDTQA
jgi:hypothetical protein